LYDSFFSAPVAGVHVYERETETETEREMLLLMDTYAMCVDDVTIQFARSSGAGGQNVNKVNTKVDMRLNLTVDWLDEEVADAVRRMQKKRINKDDELVIMSQRTRSQLCVHDTFSLVGSMCV
jgi:protein subunit release factor B